MRIEHVIVDRDGVLNREDSGCCVASACDWIWEHGAREGLRELTRAGVRVSVATNQAAVGRGLMSAGALAQVHERMLAEAAAAGGRIDAVFVCPHAPEMGCNCRKPAPGLIHSAIAVAGVGVAQTLLVGDDVRDIEAAWSAGVAPALVRTGKGHDTASQLPDDSVPVYDDLLALAAAVRDNAIAPHSATRQTVHSIFVEHGRVVEQAAAQLPAILEQVVAAMSRALARGNKVLACGNGGSAADAQHLIAELVGRFRAERRPLAAMALGADPVMLTAIANDFGYERLFARQLEALARPGDLLVAFSTSGSSANVLAAARKARALGCTVIALTGQDGGQLGPLADLWIAAPSSCVARIQEIHALCVHVLADAIDRLASTGEAP